MQDVNESCKALSTGLLIWLSRQRFE